MQRTFRRVIGGPLGPVLIFGDLHLVFFSLSRPRPIPLSPYLEHLKILGVVRILGAELCSRRGNPCDLIMAESLDWDIRVYEA